MVHQSSVNHILVRIHVKVEIDNNCASYCMAGYYGWRGVRNVRLTKTLHLGHNTHQKHLHYQHYYHHWMDKYHGEHVVVEVVSNELTEVMRLANEECFPQFYDLNLISQLEKDYQHHCVPHLLHRYPRLPPHLLLHQYRTKKKTCLKIIVLTMLLHQ